MKKKIIVIILLLCMLIPIVGIIMIILTGYNELAAAFSPSAGMERVMQIYISLAVLLACWATLFVILIRQQSGRFFDYGKKDKLTGIGNRRYLESKYNGLELDFGQRNCVTYISFSKENVLKRFNAAIVDKLQVAAANKIAENCMENEFAARIDTGVFVVVFRCSDGLHAEQRIIDLINKLNRTEHSIIFENLAPFRSGICISENKNISVNELILNAKTAYDFACADKISACVFSPSLKEKQKIRNNLQKKFLCAIENGEFEVFLQWVYDSQKQAFVGAEALSRWNSPVDGFIMPAYYINDMHASGVIEKFDMYIIEKVCSLLEDWSKNEQYRDMIISCNITRVTVSSENFMENFRKIIKNHKFNHSHLIIEITEDSLIGDMEMAHKNILDCKDMGIRVALDDFGAGTSSISDVNNYPIDVIKVDRQFISKITTKRGAAVLKSLIELAHNLDMEVVCEGVETKKQLDVISELHSDYIQGYYFSYVFPIDEAKKHFSEFMAKQ